MIMISSDSCSLFFPFFFFFSFLLTPAFPILHFSKEFDDTASLLTFSLRKVECTYRRLSLPYINFLPIPFSLPPYICRFYCTDVGRNVIAWTTGRILRGCCAVHKKGRNAGFRAGCRDENAQTAQKGLLEEFKIRPRFITVFFVRANRSLILSNIIPRPSFNLKLIDLYDPSSFLYFLPLSPLLEENQSISSKTKKRNRINVDSKVENVVAPQKRKKGNRGNKERKR